MRSLILIFICLIPCTLPAQELNRYMIFFTDKQDNQFSLQQPEAFLSQRAIDRRAQYGIPLTQTDLPVSQAYIEAVENEEATVFYRSRWFNAVLAQASPAAAARLKSLSQVKDVVYIAPGPKQSGSTNEKQKSQKKFLNLQFSPPASIQNELLGVPEMQLAGYTGEGVMIAIFDGGFTATDDLPYFEHLFNESRFVGLHDFTTKTADVFRYSSHGTKALSTIAAIDSGIFIGTAPKAHFLLAVTEDVASEYIIEEYNWLLAAEWADSAGVDIISTSLGYNTFDDPSMNYTYEDMDGISTVSARAVQLASERGILVVTSAGNAGLGNWRYIVTPADAEHVLSVGAVDKDQQLAGFSSVGPSADGRTKPEVVALGVSTTVANPAGGFTTGHGTSYAAPQVAGFAAALWQALPGHSNLQIRELIMQSGSYSSDPNVEYGWGVPYFPRIKKPRTHPEELLIYPNPVLQGHLYIKFLQTAGTEAFADIYSISGRKLLSRTPLTRLYRSGSTYILPVTELSPGVYFLHLCHNEQQYIQRILKY